MTAITLLAVAGSQVIQINLAYTIVGLLVIVLGAGVAWGSLKQSVKHLESDVGEIKDDLKRIGQEFTYIYKHYPPKNR